MQRVTPIFLLSLPRSGSTLLQRMLAAHDAISTTTETWLLLPLLHARRPGGTFTKYSHWRSIIAHEDFARSLPGGERTYREELAAYVGRLYARASDPGSRYFLDKTPRYALIADELLDLFPHAKLIILWRNPLAIAASMMQTWSGGKWNLDDHRIDFFDGVLNMLKLQSVDDQRVIALRYEELLADPQHELGRVFAHLDLAFDPALLERFADVQLPGRFGDQTGVRDYKQLSAEPLDKWKAVLSNPIRRAWGRRYLRWLGRERLAVMGHDMDVLLRSLNDAPRSYRYFWSDAVRRSYGAINAALEMDMVRAKHNGRARLPRVAHS